MIDHKKILLIAQHSIEHKAIYSMPTDRVVLDAKHNLSNIAKKGIKTPLFHSNKVKI